MGLRIPGLGALLVFCAAASALPSPFPHGKITEYDYYADAKAGIIEPAAYAAQFAVHALLRVMHDTSDETLPNAFRVSLTNVKTGMHNGLSAHWMPIENFKQIGEDAKAIETPFLIVFNESGNLEGVKIFETEPGWSRNMKMAMASMLRLDLLNLMPVMGVKPHSFITEENTIHGDCTVNYNIQVKDQFVPEPDQYIVTKFTSPRTCTGYVIDTFNHVEREACQAEKEEPVNVASRRVFGIERRNDGIIIKKLIAHGGSNYFPWNSRSEAHYVLNNATFIFQGEIPIENANQATLDFSDVPLTRDLSYQKPKARYALDAGIDVTQGRRVLDQDTLVKKLKNMLAEAADYIEENHVDTGGPDWKHGQTINRMLLNMNYMTAESFEEVAKLLTTPGPKIATMRAIFLDMLTQVGTPASCLFVVGKIRENEVTAIEAVNMLMKLPFNVRVWSGSLLSWMEDLVKLENHVEAPVRHAAILCFSSMIHELAKRTEIPDENEWVVKYVEKFFDKFQNEPNYGMKIIYLMALRNIQYGNIVDKLEPIISEVMENSEESENLRLLAIWAIEKSIARDYSRAYKLLWPLMSASSLPVKIRIAAYEILMHQAPTMADVLHIYWFMVYEKNEHLYNYHHTTLMGIANSMDPCKLHLRAMARKIMRYTRVHEKVRYATAFARIYDYEDERYNYAQKFSAGVALNEFTGAPEVIKFEHVITEGRKPYEHIGIRVHVKGLDAIMSRFKRGTSIVSNELTDSSVLDLLQQARLDTPNNWNLRGDLIITLRGKVVMTLHFTEETITEVIQAVYGILESPDFKYNSQRVNYDQLYEQQVTSELGIPVVFMNRVPILASLKIDFNSEPGPYHVQINFKIHAVLWRHGDYSITTFNTMSNVWHSVRRSTAIDISLPIRGHIIFNKRNNGIKIVLPIQPVTARSIGGVSAYAKDWVTVNEDDAATLVEFCPTCRPQEEVSKGPDAKKNYLTTGDSKDTGLRYKVGVFGCETGVTPITVRKEWFRAFASERMNDWNDWLAHTAMAILQKIRYAVISPNMGSCGGIIQIQPSDVYPTAHMDISAEGHHEEDDNTNVANDPNSSNRYVINARMEVMPTEKQAPMLSWEFKSKYESKRNHHVKKVNLSFRRKMPGKIDFTICVEAQKVYPSAPMDPLKLGNSNEETLTKVLIAAGETNEETCPRDGMLVRIKMKGELSEEQKKKVKNEIATGACAADAKNPLYAHPEGIVPKTPSCLEEAIRYTTLRKYTIDVTHTKVFPEVKMRVQYLEDVLRTSLAPNLDYTMDWSEPEKLRITLNYLLEKEQLSVSVVTPDRSYNLSEIDLMRYRFEGFGPVRQHAWFFPLDNTRFPVAKLRKYQLDRLKLCSIYTETVLTSDGKKVPFHLTDQWTLVTGDHYNRRFAIFAMKHRDGVAVKFYAKDLEITISPDYMSGNARVAVGDRVIENFEDSVCVLSFISCLFRITKSNDHVIIEAPEIPITAIYATNHVAFAIGTEVQGEVSGLCGHLNGTHENDIKKPYRLNVAA